MGTPQALIWTGQAGAITTGSTSFDLFNTQADFIDDAPKFANYAAKKFGYPTIEVELTSGSIYDALELSVMEYSRQVNEFNIRENLINLQGTSVDTNNTHNSNAMNATNLSQIIKLAKPYGAEVGSGGHIPLHSGSIMLETGVQDYDLNALYAAVSESGKTIEIKRIYHYQIPAMSRYWDGASGMGADPRAITDIFGMPGMSPAIKFTLQPISYDITRMQQIEMSRDVRRSAYSFQLRGRNVLRVLPVPRDDVSLWFDYIVEEDRSDPVAAGLVSSSTGSVADFSNAGFGWMNYNNINTVGRQWIYAYAFADCMGRLGNVRGKYSGIPIPDGEVQLDGDTLRSEAEAEKGILIEQLRESLEESGKRRQLERSQEEAEFLVDNLKKIPLKIYIG